MCLNQGLSKLHARCLAGPYSSRSSFGLESTFEFTQLSVPGLLDRGPTPLLAMDLDLPGFLSCITGVSTGQLQRGN